MGIVRPQVTNGRGWPGVPANVVITLLMGVVGGGRYGLLVPMTSHRLPGPAPMAAGGDRLRGSLAGQTR